MYNVKSVTKPLLTFTGGGLTLLLVGCGMGMDDVTDDGTRIFSGNGEKIYYTGRSQSGSVITYQGGTMHAQMHNTSCASCHGTERQGQRLYPRFWLVAPALTKSALTEEHDDGHGDHERYDKNSLKVAIRNGLDPAGKALNSAMPRWQISEEDMDDLTGFLLSDVN